MLGIYEKMVVSRNSLLHLCATLANLQSWIALANHVDTTAPTNYFAVFAAVFQASNRANHFHRLLLNPMRCSFDSVPGCSKFVRVPCRGRAANSPKYSTCQAIAGRYPRPILSPRSRAKSPTIFSDGAPPLGPGQALDRRRCPSNQAIQAQVGTFGASSITTEKRVKTEGKI